MVCYGCKWIVDQVKLDQVEIITRAFCSTVEYHCLVGCNFWLRYTMECSSPFNTCVRMVLRPVPEALV